MTCQVSFKEGLCDVSSLHWVEGEKSLQRTLWTRKKVKVICQNTVWGRFYFEMAPAASSPQAQPSGGRPVDLPMEKRKPSKFGNLVSLLNCFLLFDDKSEIWFGGQTKTFYKSLCSIDLEICISWKSPQHSSFVQYPAYGENCVGWTKCKRQYACQNSPTYSIIWWLSFPN